MVQIHLGVPYGSLILIGKEMLLKSISSRRDAVSRFESEGCRQFPCCAQGWLGLNPHREYQTARTPLNMCPNREKAHKKLNVVRCENRRGKIRKLCVRDYVRKVLVSGIAWVLLLLLMVLGNIQINEKSLICSG